MLIIAGKEYVAPEERDASVESYKDRIQRARAAPGCLDAAISADSVEPGRINSFELWASEEHLAAWRAVAHAPEATTNTLRADVQKYQISSSGPPF